MVNFRLSQPPSSDQFSVITTRGRTGRLEQQCASVAPKVFSGELKTPQAIWEELNSIVPKDDEFKDDFKVYTEATASKARYILTQLELVKWKKENPGKGIEKTPCSDPSILNLEHILPENPSNEWNKIVSTDKKIISECLHNIGNLCLLNKKANIKLGSSSFSTKAEEFYKTSDLITTRDLAVKYDEWNRSNIELRALELAELAVEAWPIKD